MMLGNAAPSYPHDQEGKQLIELQSLCVCVCVCVCVCARVCCRFSRVWLFATQWALAHQAPLSMEFSRQEIWSGLPCPPPGDLPEPGIKPASPAVLAPQADSSLLSHLRSPITVPRQIFCFSLAVSRSMNYLRYSILHCKNRLSVR